MEPVAAWKVKKQSKTRLGNCLKHAKSRVCSFTFWAVLHELCLTSLSDPIGVLFGLLCSLVWNLMYSQWGQRSWEWRVNVVWVLGWKTAYNENDDVTASMYFYFFQGKVDWTLTLFVTHFLTPFGDLNKWPLTYMWLPLKCMWFSVNDTLVLFVLASSLSAAFPPSFPTHSISLYVL